VKGKGSVLSAECTEGAVLIPQHCLLETYVIKAVLFDLGSTLLEFETQPWEDLQVAPHEAVFVGDRMPEDVAGAKGIGMRGVWKERPDRDRLPRVIPDAQIVQLRKLLDILDFWTERNDI
jgi:FMN phosphatase YigB (HAD superfamily)